jgi:rubrerythrin
MSLTTVGVTLNFAVDLEASTAAFYETATTITQSQDLKSLFEALIIQGQGRIQKLMQLRQQLSLDQKKTAVTGVESEPYRPKTECPPGCPDTQLIQLALAMEQQVQDFYRDSSDKLGFVEEIPVLFEDLAKDHLQNQKTLQTMS